jgi:hypothetical protein
VAHDLRADLDQLFLQKRAQARGVRFGRPLKLTRYQIEEALARTGQESRWRILVGPMGSAIRRYRGSNLIRLSSLSSR